MKDRIWWKLDGVGELEGHDIRFVVNWGSGRIYVYDQTAGRDILSK